MKRNPTTISGVDESQAAYWLSPVTRREVQTPLDEITGVLHVTSAQISALNMSMAYMFAKLGVQKAEFDAFVKSRTAQMESEIGTETPEVSKLVQPN